MEPITHIFTDVGGVLLTNGWDHTARQRAAETFKLDQHELDARHGLTFDTYEEGKLSLDEYMNRTVFYEPRSFTREEFRKFMLAQSQPYDEMLALIPEMKKKYGLKVAVVSNEGRELTTHRISTYQLNSFVDFFIVSCYVHFRKPDTDIFQLALDVAQVAPNRVAYIEDRPMFVEVAQKLGMHAIHHVSAETTRAQLTALSAPTSK